LYIPPAYRPFGFEDTAYYHPAFLYESIWDVVVFLVLFFAVRKITGIKDGTVFLAYLILYSFGRIFIEWCRMDSVLNILSIPVAQIVSVLIIMAAGVMMVRMYK
jgi:phosphatidylglycerol:prolipoprotein diacylglycerol transferase